MIRRLLIPMNVFVIIFQSGDLDSKGIARCATTAITTQERPTAKAAPCTPNIGIIVSVSGMLQMSQITRAFARTLIFPILARLLKSS